MNNLAKLSNILIDNLYMQSSAVIYKGRITCSPILTGSFFSSLFSSLWGSKELRVLILGLDGAGKTTILYRLQVGEVVTTIPSEG